MRVPGAAPTPERLSPQTVWFGPHRVVARIVEGRRTETLVVVSESDPSPQALRVVTDPEADPELAAAYGEDSRVVDGARPAFLTPLLVCESLATVLDAQLAERRALPLPIGLTIAMGVAARLEALGRPHLDLAPQHVLLGYDGTVHLIDPAPPEGRGGAAGRVGYRAPEQVAEDTLDSATDVFQLGILLFEMTTGTRLFDPEAPDVHERVRQAQLPRPRDIVGDGYPIELQLVLRKLMRPSRAGRFPNARAAQDALRLVATTRADVGSGPLAAWMLAEFSDRHAVWESLLDAPSPKAPAAAAHAQPRAPSRAQTRPSSFLGATAPTIEEHRMDSGTLEAVRRKILDEANLSEAQADAAQQALRDELEQMKRRRTELPEIPNAQTETTQPGTRPAMGAEDTHEDLDVPPLRPEAHGGASARRGLAASPPPTMVPELPTEVTRRFRPLPQPLGLEPADSDAATSLDELEAAPAPLVAVDMIGPPPTLELPEGPPGLPGGSNPPDFSLGPGAEPGSLADLSPESLLAPSTDRSPAPTDLEPPPPTPSPAPAPDLSEDLVLDPFTPLERTPTETASRGAPQMLAATDLIERPAPPPAEPGEAGDTIQDDAPLELLGADGLAQLQRAVEVVPDAAFGVRPPAPMAERPEAPAPDAGPEPDLPVASPPAAPPPRPTEARSALEPAPLEPAPRSATPPAARRSLGAAPPPKNQAVIPTQVVRDRIVPNDGPAEPTPGLAEPPPMLSPALPAPLAEDERELTPTPHLDLGPPSASVSEDETSSAHLVIPISDDELAATERKRRNKGAVALGAGLAVALLGAGAAWKLGALDRWLAPKPVRAPVQAAPSAAPPAPEPAEALVPDEPEAVEVMPIEPAETETAMPAAPKDSPVPEAEAPPPAPAAPPKKRRAGPVARRPRAPNPPKSWRLTVRALPEQARVLIDGQPVANNTAIELTARGPVEVQVSAEGYVTETKTVPRNDAVVDLHILLRRAQ